MFLQIASLSFVFHFSQMKSSFSLRRKSSSSKTPTQHVSKTHYTKWASNIFKAVDTLLPTDGHPTVAYRRKVVLMVDFDVPEHTPQQSESSRVQESSTKRTHSSLTTKCKIQLHHFGKGSLDGVSVGYDTTRNCFKHPATDFGGLTNVNQQPGEAVSFVGTPTPITTKTTTSRVTSLSNTLLDQWRTHSQRSSLHNESAIHKHLQSFLQSVVAVLKDGSTSYTRAHLRFHVLTPELRMLYTMNDIHTLTGTYMVRDFNGDDTHFAHTVSTNVKSPLYLSVSRSPRTGERFITPNINRQNILNEYVGAI